MSAALCIPAPRFTDAWLAQALRWSPADQEGAPRNLCGGSYGGIASLPDICSEWEWVRLAQRLAWHHGAERALVLLNAAVRP